MYEIAISDKAEKQMAKLDRQLQERIFAVLERVRVRPEAILHKVAGQDCYRFRVGDYRAFVDIIESDRTVLVTSVRHRKNAYDSL